MLWKINHVERAKSNGFILKVIWECNDSRNGFVGRLTDTFGFEVDEPKIPFDQVTEEMVIGWVKEKLGQHEVNRIESVVQSMIDDNINNDKVTGTPW
jgi:hypothetical protein